MKLPGFVGITDIRQLDPKNFNKWVGLLYRYWNDHQAGVVPFDTVLLNGLATNVTTKTGSYTATFSDVIILADATSAALTITLPDATLAKGRWFVIKRTNTNKNLVTIATTSSQTIDGATNYFLGGPYHSTTLFSDGSNWQILF